MKTPKPCDCCGGHNDMEWHDLGGSMCAWCKWHHQSGTPKCVAHNMMADRPPNADGPQCKGEWLSIPDNPQLAKHNTCCHCHQCHQIHCPEFEGFCLEADIESVGFGRIRIFKQPTFTFSVDADPKLAAWMHKPRRPMYAGRPPL